MSPQQRDYFDLEGEVAVVTGGRGLLGGEFVKTLAAAGASVASIDIKDTTQSESETSGKSVSPLVLQADITKLFSVKMVFDGIEKKLGTPTILINCAGIDVPPNASVVDNGPFEDVPESAWDAVIDSHLKGAFLVSQEFVRRNRVSERGGSIINISSTYGVIAPDQSMYDFRRRRGENFYKPVAYSVAKSGMLNFTRWLAEYCGPYQIRVNTLVLGGVLNEQEKEFVQQYSRRTMLNRMANRDEYNGAVLFLASRKASSYMTGSIVTVDGGWTAR